MTRPERRSWLDCFTKLANREMRVLYMAPFTAVQHQIVLYILAQTRGTGRIMAGEMDDAAWDEWETVRGSYGRESAPLFRGSIAAAIGRHHVTVKRELRRLIDAGVIVEHEEGCKGTPAVLSVDLDPSHWDASCLSSAVAKRLPKVNRSSPECGSESATESPECGSDSGSESATESPKCGSESAPLFKRPENLEEKKETLDPRAAEERGSSDPHQHQKRRDDVVDMRPVRAAGGNGFHSVGDVVINSPRLAAAISASRPKETT